jgi:hypothetical protein
MHFRNQGNQIQAPYGQKRNSMPSKHHRREKMFNGEGEGNSSGTQGISNRF